MFKDDYKACNDSIKVNEQLKNRVRVAMENANAGAKETCRGKMFYFTRVGIPTAAGLIVIALVANLFMGLLRENGIQKAESLKNYTSYTELYEDIERSNLHEQEELYLYSPGFKGVQPEGEVENAGSSDGISDIGNGNLSQEYSDTNVQVEGIDEADIVKTDGAYIYILSHSEIHIVSADGASMKEVSAIELPADYYSGNGELYLYDNNIALLYYSWDTGNTSILTYDISNRAAPVPVKTLTQSGRYVASRMINGILYTISDKNIYYSNIDPENYETYVPQTTQDGVLSYISYEDIYGCMGKSRYDKQSCELVTSCNISDANEFISTKSVIGQTATVYMSAESLYLCMYNGIALDEDSDAADFSTLVKFSVSGGVLEMQASGNVPGCILNQFSMDEYQGYFRIATTVDRYSVEKKVYLYGILPRFYEQTLLETQMNGVYVLDENLNIVGQVTDLAKGEDIYSVRFQKDTGYVVTFYQTDPLFEIDLSDPRNPIVTDVLKITGVSDYLHSIGDNLLLGIGRHGTKRGLTGKMKLSMFRVNAEGENEEIHKLVLQNTFDSEALYNHKAILIDVEKRLLAFPVSVVNPDCAEDYDAVSAYAVFSYTEESGFVEKGLISSGADTSEMEKMRGLYIDRILYVISADRDIKACDMETCQVLSSLQF